ncbi:MAG: glycosyltransferase, partial [Thalassobaculaceae bacterium]
DLIKRTRSFVIRAAADALPNVTWRPATDDMRVCYRAAAVVLAPSLVEETWGRIVSEAQVSGIPALVSDRGALPETVGAGGVVVGADASLDDWCAALTRMWDDRAFYDQLTVAARAMAVAPARAPQRVLDQWAALIAAADV